MLNQARYLTLCNVLKSSRFNFNSERRSARPSMEQIERDIDDIINFERDKMSQKRWKTLLMIFSMITIGMYSGAFIGRVGAFILDKLNISNSVDFDDED
jgi:hypothetical protein